MERNLKREKKRKKHRKGKKQKGQEGQTERRTNSKPKTRNRNKFMLVTFKLMHPMRSRTVKNFVRGCTKRLTSHTTNHNAHDQLPSHSRYQQKRWTNYHPIQMTCAGYHFSSELISRFALPPTNVFTVLPLHSKIHHFQLHQHSAWYWHNKTQSHRDFTNCNPHVRNSLPRLSES